MAANTIKREGAAPNTRLLNSLKVKIFSIDCEDTTATQIGLVQTWTPTHSRTITANRGIGYGDQIAELSVGITELTANAEVLGMYLRNIMQVFGYKADTSGIVRSLKHHKWPFDVREEIWIPNFLTGEYTQGNDGEKVVTNYIGCWMNNWGHSYTISDVNVSQSADITITDVTDSTYIYDDTKPTVAKDGGGLSAVTA